MRTTSLALTVLVTTSILGCGEPIRCGIFEWDPDRNRCVCPSDTVELDDGSCMLSDGGVVFPPGTDAGSDRDAGGGLDAGAHRDADTLVDSGASQDADGRLDASEPVDAGEDAAAPEDACADLTFYADRDGDGFGDPAAPTTACFAPAGTVASDDDCDDDCITCHPGGTESCNDRDDDCNGVPDADEDTLCTFGNACIDGSCRGIPIYRWSAHFQPRTGGAVSRVLIRSSPTGGPLAVVGYRGLVDVGTRALPGGTDVSAIALVTFGPAGEVVGVHEIGRAVAPAVIGVTAFAVDAVGNMYVSGSFRGGATVQARGMHSSTTASYLTRIPTSGADWVRDYRNVAIADVEARDDGGFVACGTFTGSVSGTAGTLMADVGGDGLLMLGRTDGVLERLVPVSGAGPVLCGDVAARGGVNIATGTYSGGVASVGGSPLATPDAVDVWAVAFRDDGSLTWTSSGGSPFEDRSGAAVISQTGSFLAASFYAENTFAGVPVNPDPSVTLFRYPGGGSPHAFHAYCSALDEGPAAWVTAATATASGAPVLGLNLSSDLSSSVVRFGRTSAGDSGSTEPVVLGYSRDGAAARWLLQLFGPLAEEVHAASRVGDAEIAVSGFFETTIRLAPTVTLSGATGQHGFVGVYRVR